MRSLKQGRGPSAMGAVGSVIAILFGIFWTVFAWNMTRNVPLVGTIFPLFGVLFVLFGIANLVYSLYNTTARNRLSLLDLTETGEEPDPLNQRFGGKSTPGPRPSSSSRKYAGDFCPFCGGKVDRTVDFCPHCGKDI